MSPTRHRPARRRGLLVPLLAVALVVSGCSWGDDDEASTTTDQPAGTTTTSSADRSTTSTSAVSTTTTSAPPAVPTLTWAPCDDGYQCAELEVPVDHDRPGSPTLTLALARRPATGPGERLGSLLMNPGGPGGSAIAHIEGTPLPVALTQRFDIVGFDPRGVGRSAPLDCRTHLQAIYDADPTMEDEADVDAYLEASRSFVDECGREHEDLLPHLGTVDVVRDMELVRQALGDEQLTYIGRSYGTSIGEQYARRYPTKVRAMVLDGMVDSSLTGLQAAAVQAKGFHQALANFTARCDADDCGLDAPAGQVIDEVVAASELAPIPASRSDRPATPGVVTLALSQALYSETLWPELARALSQASHGDANGLVSLADRYLDRNPDGSYPNGFEVYFAVSCLDSAWPEEPETVLETAEVVGALYPRVGEALVNDYVRCALWPVPPEPLVPLDDTVEGLAPVVILSTTGDPATPHESGLRAAARIPGAVLVTNEGEGHTIFAQGKACIDDPVTAYLVDLTPPPPGLTCE